MICIRVEGKIMCVWCSNWFKIKSVEMRTAAAAVAKQNEINIFGFQLGL